VVPPDLYTAAELAEVRAYHQPYYTYAACDAVVWPLVAVLAARYLTKPLFRASERLAAALGRRLAGVRSVPVLRAFPAVLDRLWNGPGWGAALIFALAYFQLFLILDLPRGIYFGFIREHAYGMSTESAASFAWDAVKGNLLTVAAVSALTLGLFGLARRLRAWWRIMAVVASVVMIGSAALDPYRARVYFDQEPLPQGELRDRISALMAKADIDFRDVLVDKTSAKTVRLQAYFAGTGPTRTINLNDSLLAGLTTDEILAAVGHEAGHVGEPRWPARLGSAAALLLFLLAVERLFRAAAARRWFEITERADVRTLPLIMLLFDLSSMVIGPLSGAASRARESAADRYAVRLTGNPEAFRSMLVKAARTNKMDPEPPRWYVLKGVSHPPVGERLEAVMSARPKD